MALIYLLDTNLVSEPVRTAPDAHVVAHIQMNVSSIAISATTWHEMLFGLFKMPASHKQRVIEQYLFKTVQREIPILPYDADAAAWFAKERARLGQTGRLPSYPDGQIAAIAATNHLTLVTRNVSDFADFADLKVENWFRS